MSGPWEKFAKPTAPPSPMVLPGQWSGLQAPGNLDLDARKVFDAPDGSYRTENSITVGTDNGAVLLPTIIDGKQVSNDEAIAHWKQTGENLGTFDSEADAEPYAQALHERQATKYKPAPAAAAATAAGPWTKYQATPEAAVPPSDLKPGSRGYADWAAAAARAGKKLPQVSPAPPPLENPGFGTPPPSPSVAQYVSQGASGFNEGLADTLGLPMEASAFVLNKGEDAVDAVLGTHLPRFDHFVGGQKTFRDLLSPAIAPEADDPRLKFVRRVGSEAGAAALPGAGLAGATAKPLATLGAEAASALAAGTGAAGARTVAPGNPWAELGAELAGGFTPGSLVNATRRAVTSKVAPTIAELSAAKDAAYAAADQAGVKYKPQAFKGMAADMVQSAIADNISAARHPVAVSVLKDIVGQADKGFAPSLTQLDQIRQVIRRDITGPAAKNPAMEADGHFGNMMIDKIDDFIAKAGSKDVISGDPGKAGSLILTAREINTRMRKTEIVQEAIDRAKLQAASSGSGGNINNAIRTQFKSILNNRSRVRNFSPEERATMMGLVKQGRIDELLRYVGKFAPGGSGLIGTLELGAAAVHPATLAAPAAGFVAKSIADARTVGKAEKFAGDVARGGKAAASTVPRLTPAQTAAAKQQLLVELTNLQNQEQATASAR